MTADLLKLSKYFYDGEAHNYFYANKYFLLVSAKPPWFWLHSPPLPVIYTPVDKQTERRFIL